jgi:hypothetical protein
MLDACGSEIEGYDQRAWDCVIRKAIVGVQPVKFKDFDGAEYYVKVMDQARHQPGLLPNGLHLPQRH